MTKIFFSSLDIIGVTQRQRTVIKLLLGNMSRQGRGERGFSRDLYHTYPNVDVFLNIL